MTSESSAPEKILFVFFFPLFFVLSAILFEYSGVDIWWVSHFYDSEKQLWPYAQHWLFEDILHSGGQLLDKIFALLWVLSFIVINCKKEFFKYRKIFIYFLLASAAGPSLVALGKSMIHIYSPWDLQFFCGTQPYIRMFDSVPAGAPAGRAFPAGHASGGYCFLSLYFVFLRYRSSYRFHGLVFALLLGLLFGTAQQIRGAHFPSHDFATVAVCWSACTVIYFLFYPGEWRLLQE